MAEKEEVGPTPFSFKFERYKMRGRERGGKSFGGLVLTGLTEWKREEMGLAHSATHHTLAYMYIPIYIYIFIL